MRPPTLMLSVLVHAGALGAAVAFGASYAAETRKAPRVEIRTTVASAPAPARHDPAEHLPAVLPEASPLPAELPDDPIVPERELHREVLEPEQLDAPPVTRVPEPRVSTARIRPDEVTPPEAEPDAAATPAPASVHVAASPRADNPPPPFPDHERALGREGDVVLKVVVDRHGLVVDVELVTGSYPGFNRAALAAVRRWRFEPGTVDGAAVADEVTVTIEFRLDGR